MRKDYDDFIRMIENNMPGFEIERIHRLCFEDKWMLNEKFRHHNFLIDNAYSAGKKELAVQLLKELRDELCPQVEEVQPGEKEKEYKKREEEHAQPRNVAEAGDIDAPEKRFAKAADLLERTPALPSSVILEEINTLWKENESLRCGGNGLAFDALRESVSRGEYGKAADSLRRLRDGWRGSSEEEQVGEGVRQKEEIPWEQLRMEAHTRLTMLRKTIESVSPEDSELRTIDAMLEKMRAYSYTLAVVGEFNRGKSSLINALLGMQILPADVTPTTATINRVVYGETPGVRLCMQDGSEEAIPFTMLKARVTKLSEEAQAAANRVREAVISYPTVFCRNNVSILDTPGLNESVQMDELTLLHTRKVDAVIFLISALVPFSQSEARALIRLLTDSNIRHVLFTVSFIDRLPQEEGVEQRVLSSIRKRIFKTAFPFIDADSNLSPQEKERQKAILSEAPILGVSAKKALDAFVNGKMEDLRQSHIEEYKKELMTRLTAQQDEWLAQDVMPYVQRTLAVFNDVSQRRIQAFERDIQKGKELIDEGKRQLASLQSDRQTCIDRWANSVRMGVGTRDMCRAKLLRVVNEHMKRYTNPGAVNSGAGLKNWAKRQGMYRDEYDPATKQLRAAFEDAKSFGVGMCDHADKIARAEYPAVYREICALAQKVCEGLNEAIKTLRAQMDELATPAFDTPDGNIAIFGAEVSNLLVYLPMPGVSLGSFEGAKQSLGNAVADKFYTKFETSLQDLCTNSFPALASIKEQYNRAVAELEQRMVYLNERLAKLREEAATMGKLL